MLRDRWSQWDRDPIDVDEYNKNGFVVSVYDDIYPDIVGEWNKRYGKYEIIEQPIFKEKYNRGYIGTIRLHNIEEYAQFMADEYGRTTPDARIYYNDGSVKEIFSTKTVW